MCVFVWTRSVDTRLGPTARDVHEPSHMGWTREQITDYIMDKCKFLVPEINDKARRRPFCVPRARCAHWCRRR